MNAPRQTKAEGTGRLVQLTPALQELARREKYLALEVRGTRYDLGMRYGLLRTQLALGLTGVDRERVLTELLEVMAETRLWGA